VLHLFSKQAKEKTIDINEPALRETVSLAGNNKNSLSTFMINITGKASVEELLNKAIAEFGSVDGIINNASACG